MREGREKLDFSEWDTYSTWQKHDKLESICGLIATGRMPLRIYTAMHPGAKLTEENKKTVCAWGRKQLLPEDETRTGSPSSRTQEMLWAGEG